MMLFAWGVVTAMFAWSMYMILFRGDGWNGEEE